jgi:serine O-acetyltransferase
VNLITVLREDLRAYEDHAYRKVRWWYWPLLPLNPALSALVIMRLSQWFTSLRLTPLARIFYVMNIYLFGCEIRPEAKFGPGFFMAHPTGVIIGGVTIGRNAIIGPRAGIGGPTGQGWPTVGDNLTMYVNASILGSITVGDDVVIGAHSLVTQDVPSGVLVAGAPARVVRKLSAEEIRKRRRPSERDKPLSAGAEEERGA